MAGGGCGGTSPWWPTFTVRCTNKETRSGVQAASFAGAPPNTAIVMASGVVDVDRTRSLCMTDAFDTTLFAEAADDGDARYTKIVVILIFFLWLYNNMYTHSKHSCSAALLWWMRLYSMLVCTCGTECSRLYKDVYARLSQRPLYVQQRTWMWRTEWGRFTFSFQTYVAQFSIS